MDSHDRRRQISNVAVGYGIAGAVWVGASDQLLARLVDDPYQQLLLSQFKGWFFILITASLLSVVLRQLVAAYDKELMRERSVSDDQLRHSETRYRMLFDANPYPMWLYDESTLKFLAVNDAAVDAYGFTRSEFLDMTILDIRPAEERTALLRKLVESRYVDEGLGVRRGIWRHCRKSGSCFHVDVVSSPMPSENGASRLVMARDVSQELQSGKALEDSKELLSELSRRLVDQEQEVSRRFAQALHDQLGQSLVVCKLLVETAVSEGDIDMRKRTQALHQATAQLEAATQWVREMMFELHPVLLEERGLLAALRADVTMFSLLSKGAELHVSCDAGTETIRWPAEVEYTAYMIIREALVNAAQHAQARHVWGHVRGDIKLLGCEVLDDGVGIPQEALDGAAGHLGVVGIRHRARHVGGRVEIERRSQGGTRLRFEWRSGD